MSRSAAHPLATIDLLYEVRLFSSRHDRFLQHLYHGGVHKEVMDVVVVHTLPRTNVVHQVIKLLMMHRS